MSDVAGSTRNIVICDLDGTLALDDHRNHLISGAVGTRKWDEYFKLCHLDEPNHPIIQLVRILHAARKQIYILSGRSESTRSKTLVWLDDNKVPYDQLVMRRIDSRTDDYLLKLSWVDDLSISERIWLILEDRTRVVEAWRSRGYACLQVRPGDF